MSRVKGNHCQMSAIMMAARAPSAWVISAGKGRPSQAKNWCTGLMSGV